ncbi:MAG: hypothetical protein ACOY9Y_05810 [Bacillota bacterium]
MEEAKQAIAGYLQFCNTARVHSALGCLTPQDFGAHYTFSSYLGTSSCRSP